MTLFWTALDMILYLLLIGPRSLNFRKSQSNLISGHAAVSAASIIDFYIWSAAYDHRITSPTFYRYHSLHLDRRRRYLHDRNCPLNNNLPFQLSRLWWKLCKDPIFTPRNRDSEIVESRIDVLGTISERGWSEVVWMCWERSFCCVLGSLDIYVNELLQAQFLALVSVEGVSRPGRKMTNKKAWMTLIRVATILSVKKY